MGLRGFASVLLGVACLATASTSDAADDKQGNREARRAQLLLQRLDDESSRWQVERTALQKQIADREQALSALQSTDEEGKRNSARLAGENAELKRKTAALEKTLAEQQQTAAEKLNARDREIESFAQARKQERVQLNARYDSGVKALAACEDRNVRLAKVGHELLARYRDKPLIDVLRQREPVLQLDDVEMFNVVQEYRDKIDAERLQPPAPGK